MKNRKLIALIAVLAIFAAACGTAEEVVDVHDNLADMEEAKEFFYLKKRIPSKDDFERLYEVKSDDREENKKRD